MGDNEKKLVNALMAASDKCNTIANTMWWSIHGLSEWDCGDCGNGGTGGELNRDDDGTPLCSWCSSDKVRPRAEQTDVDGATAENLEDNGEHDAYFTGEFGAWLESMQADGYASDDIARAVKAECESLLGGR
jgi:hypothetical protein